jgi:hypothetical protein
MVKRITTRARTNETFLDSGTVFRKEKEDNPSIIHYECSFSSLRIQTIYVSCMYVRQTKSFCDTAKAGIRNACIWPQSHKTHAHIGETHAHGAVAAFSLQAWSKSIKVDSSSIKGGVRVIHASDEASKSFLVSIMDAQMAYRSEPTGTHEYDTLNPNGAGAAG